MQTFNDNKAGMVGLDKERIQKIIEENTSPSFDEYAKKRSERITSRIEHNRKLLTTFTPQQIAKAQCEMDELVESLEEGRDLSRIALHIDMDAFYAAVEMRDDPSLRTVPMAVGSDSMLSTSNYIARRYGVRAAMPGFIGRKLCPELKIVPCDFHKYRAASHEVTIQTILKRLLESTSNYIARRYGVRAAMPGFIGRKLCPELKIVPCDFHKYRAASHEVTIQTILKRLLELKFHPSCLVRKVFEEYDGNFQMGSLDEAYLDISEYALTRLEPDIIEKGRTILFLFASCCYGPNCATGKCAHVKNRIQFFEVRKVFEEYDSNFQMGSLDEAYLDISEYALTRLEPVERARIRYTGDCICRLPLLTEDEKEEMKNAKVSEELCGKCGKMRISVCDMVCFGTDIEEIVRELRFRVEQATGLTCSAGIAPNSMIAKICSDINKPNGQFRIANSKEAVLKFMRDLPIRKVSGIGAVTEAILKGIEVEKCGDLYEKRAIISLLFTRCSYEHFLRIALGISTSYTSFVTSEKESRRKSISVERTFHPTGDISLLIEITESLCNELIESLSKRLIRGGYSATVKMKFSTFDVITRCVSVDYVICDISHLMPLCERIIRNELREGNKQLRLLGVRLSRLLFIDDKVESMKSLTSFWSNVKHDRVVDAETDGDGIEGIDEEGSNDATSLFRSSAVSSSKSSTDSSENEIGKRVVQLCPICEAELPDELSAVNRHVDECLNRQAIAELQNEKKEGGESLSKSRKRSSKRGRSPTKPTKSSSVDGMRKKISIRDYFTTRNL
uniref:DNA polymerase kappa n=1 Tax=Ascaris lumbricoides TaxID=6252 RepID=A0A9J2Q302_ASCLU